MDVRAAHPFLQLERTGADRRLVGRIGAVVGAVIDVLGHDRRRAGLPRHDERRERLLQLEDDGVRIGRDHVLGALHDRARARMDLDEIFLRGEDDVVGGERLAVMPFHVLLELERVGQAVGRDAPRLGEARHRLEVEIVAQQAFVDLAGDDRGRRRLVDADHQGRRLGRNDDVHRAAALRRLRRGLRREHDGGGHGCSECERATHVSLRLIDAPESRLGCIPSRMQYVIIRIDRRLSQERTWRARSRWPGSGWK